MSPIFSCSFAGQPESGFTHIKCYACSQIDACLAAVKNFLVFAKKVDIRVISLDVDYYADVVLPVGELRNTIAVDVDRKEGEVKVTC